MRKVALGWPALVTTNSPGFAGIVAFAAGIPFVVIAVAASSTLWASLPLLFLGNLLGPASMSGNTVLFQHGVAENVRGYDLGA